MIGFLAALINLAASAIFSACGSGYNGATWFLAFETYVSGIEAQPKSLGIVTTATPLCLYA